MRALGNGMDLKKRMTEKTFEKGDFVRVNDNTHDENLPPSRMGHILSEYKTIIHYTDTHPVKTGLWRIMMTNGKILNFHEMHLEHVSDLTQEK